MSRLRQWWFNELPIPVKFVFLVLLANGLPAFLILMTLPTRTDSLFVWTIKPEINARLVGVMYSNALLLVAFGALQTSWARVRITMVVITLFSVLATALTFFYLDPFLAHPWYHLTYWLSMYVVLLVAAPYVFFVQERESGGRLPRSIPLSPSARFVASASLAISLVSGIALLFQIDEVNEFWAWQLPPLVGGLIGVLLLTHAAAFSWALWDGDWLRVRPMFWQAPITGLLLVLLPLVHLSDLHSDVGWSLPVFYIVVGLMALTSLGVIASYRPAERAATNDG